ncbi:MAG: phosphatidate cytidylyltransferase [Planctomycetota bacterium]
MLRHRLITGTLLTVALLALLWADGELSARLRESDPVRSWLGSSDGVLLLAFSLAVLAPLLARELAALLRGSGIAAPTALTVAAAVLGVAAVRAMPGAATPPAAAAIAGTTVWLVLAGALVAHTRGQRVEGVVAATGGTLLAFAWIGAMLGTWLLVRMQVGPWVMAGAVLTVKASDIGAYFTGMSIGRHKMIPWLSPKKSWEGLVGGIAFAALVGGLLAWWSSSLDDPRDHVPVALGAATGAVLGVLGPFGDLAESLLKRSAGAKDSGATLPGMGGLLDVLDSPLLAGPAVLWALSLR